jgi:deazaflavin-dependent oxidoreductase (nitroreductase family)
MDPHIANLLRRVFKIFNRFMLLMWRLGLGRWMNNPRISGQIMVISHTGRRTGLRRRTPVNYAIVDGELYCLAGFGRFSDWYLNVMANPSVEVWLPGERWTGEAEDITATPDNARLMRQVLIGSGFAARLAGINPKTMSDEELLTATHDYRLLNIRRTSPLTGPGGPGDLAWIWPVATFLLLVIGIQRARTRRGDTS